MTTAPTENTTALERFAALPTHLEKDLYFQRCWHRMDESIRKGILYGESPDSQGEFLTIYAARHREKFGSAFDCE